MITRSTGVISTVTGNGIQGYSGDGFAVTLATLNKPRGVAIDASGNLYIADSGNNVIRMISAGIISTVAGTTEGYSGNNHLALGAKFSSPNDVAVDVSGNLYIADTNNMVIRMVTKNTGFITTVAGNGNQGYSGEGGLATSAELDHPSGLTVDTSGNIYFADTFNNRIRVISHSTGFITTLVGNGNPGYSGDGGLATSAELNGIRGVAVDASGNLYLVDPANNRVRMVTASTGIITTVAGTGISGYSGDGGAATLAELRIPSGIALDVSGNIYFNERDNNVIRVVTQASPTFAP